MPGPHRQNVGGRADARLSGRRPLAMNYALLVVVWLSWGLSYPLMAIALEGFDVWTCRTIIMLLGGSGLLLLALARRKSLAVPRALWRDLLIAALCNMTL